MRLIRRLSQTVAALSVLTAAAVGMGVAFGVMALDIALIRLLG